MSLGEFQKNLKALSDRLEEQLDIEALALDEHLRIAPYFRLLRDSSEDRIRESIALVLADPDRAMRTSVVNSWFGHIAKSCDSKEFARWIHLIHSEIDADEFLSRRSSETEFCLRCKEGDAASISKLANGPAWVQARLAQTCDLLKVLEELSANGSFKKTRAQATHRLTLLRRNAKS
jgi:hypothetical protein